MRGYEFTERGKIILAIVLVLIVLVIPAAVIALKSAYGAEPGPAGESPVTETPVSPPEASVTQSPGQAVTNAPESETPPAGAEASAPEQSPGQTGDQPPEQTANPPEQTANPPEQTANPPEQTANPPEQTANPPEQTAKPPEVQSGQAEETPAAESTLPPETSSDNKPKDGERLSFIFSPRLLMGLDEATEQKLDSFLKTPEYLPNFKIAVETPQISEDDARALMSTVTGALAERGIKSSQVEHISFPPAVSGDSFEVVMYFVSVYEK